MHSKQSADYAAERDRRETGNRAHDNKQQYWKIVSAA
jgi:hypothetical protein